MQKLESFQHSHVHPVGIINSLQQDCLIGCYNGNILYLSNILVDRILKLKQCEILSVLLIRGSDINKPCKQTD